jgi:hypothetical protein
VPIAMICHVSNANQGVIFATCMLGLIPLASASKQLAVFVAFTFVRPYHCPHENIFILALLTRCF